MADQPFQSEDGDGPAFDPASPWYVRHRAFLWAIGAFVVMAAALVAWQSLR